jgi:hypothetical protein
MEIAQLRIQNRNNAQNLDFGIESDIALIKP